MGIPDISYREVRETDWDFLWKLREATMRAVVERHRAWDTLEQEKRLRMALQGGLVISSNGLDIGMLKIERRHNHIELVQLQLEPAWQGRGIGSKIVEDLQAEAAAAGLPLVLHLHASSRAMHLFERLGFGVSGTLGPFHGLRWEG